MTATQTKTAKEPTPETPKTVNRPKRDIQFQFVLVDRNTEKIDFYGFKRKTGVNEFLASNPNMELVTTSYVRGWRGDGKVSQSFTF